MQIRLDSKAFQGRQVLGRIEFSLARGGRTALLGPSGCGKTTLLRILCGLDTDFKGTVERGHSRLGLVFQEPRLLPWKTVYENVALVAPQRHRSIIQLLQAVGLLEVAALEASRLSLGMARRVALARALAIQPDVLILDEPFNSLDRARAAELRRLLLQIVQDRDLKMLLVTHDPHEAVQLANQVLLLEGQPCEIRQRIHIDLTPDERHDAQHIAHRVNVLLDPHLASG